MPGRTQAGLHAQFMNTRVWFREITMTSQGCSLGLVKQVPALCKAYWKKPKLILSWDLIDIDQIINDNALNKCISKD